MTTLTVPRRQAAGSPGLRPLDLWHDAEGVTRLLRLCFSDDLAHNPKAARDIVLLEKGGALFWLLARLSPEFHETFAGFVWEDDGRIVGNVTISREGPSSRIWTIGNVAVHPDLRRRGIARALMEAALGYVQDHGGGLATLEVRADNTAAYPLYVSLGFHYLDGRTHLLCSQVIPLAGPIAPMRRERPHDGEAVRRLARACTPSDAQGVMPLPVSASPGGPLSRTLAPLLTLAHGQTDDRLVLDKAGEVVAWVRLRIQRLGPGPHILDVLVHPEHAHRLAHPVVATALTYLSHAPLRPLACTLRPTDDAVLAALREAGFVEQETLHRLARPVAG